ncbi:TonB-dependent receptor [Filimonas effusa]|uniref:TonB-dependent receptor n=1 Tax=Filimonas effusa TaxID=2508721 RepID=A0A4Q1DES0_9BACT|nr:TonB-dependent receptor [Filimonas effusa]
MKKLLLLLWLLSSLVVTAQTGKTVSGKVTDETGAPLLGVSVTLSGRTTGTATNAEGRFRIAVPSDTAQITFSYTGMLDQTFRVGTKNVIDVVMTRADKVLDQVVVVGYGTQKRRDVTGAVVSIKPADLENMPNVNIVQSLQGKLPGLTIVNTGTSAEGSTKMRVRAQNSISADAGPLIVLDGIQYEGFLSEINPNDIESIEVLKDASSAAIYGARAAGGVLLVTTKRGVAGKTTININSTIGISNIINRPDMMDATQFYNFKEARLGASSYEKEQFEKGVNTDWLSHAMQTGIMQEYGVAVSGGAEKTRYYISGNVNRTKGVAKNDQFNRYTFRVNMESDITSWLKYGTNTVLGYHDRPGVQANISNATRMNPLLEPYDANGNIKLQPNPDDMGVTNPLEGLNTTKEDVARSINTTNYFHIKFPFIKGLSLKTIAGYNYRNRLIETYEASTATLEGQSKKGVAIVNNQYKQDWSLENIFNYNRKFGLHNLDLTYVYTAREATTKYHDNTGVGFLGDYMSYYQFRLATSLTPSDTYEKQTQLSQLGRVNYNFNSKYLFTFSVRRDGFSAFGANNKYGVFPSVALGWNMERESFMQATSAWLTRSKLRLSYGENGNQAIAAYATMPTMSTDYYLNNDKTTLVGFYPNKLADPSLGWETTRQINIGWDFSMFNSRITGSIDYFAANTFDLLLNKNIPQINGVGSIRQNTGKTKSSGIEVALSTINIQKKRFSWRTDVNFARNRNSIVNVGLFGANGNALDNLGNRWFIGKPINVVYAYTFDGIWQEKDNILGSHMPEARPGDVRIKDINNDGKITTADMSVIGYADPRFTVGLMNTFTYGNWSMSFFINAVKGVTRYTEYMNTFFDGKTNIRQREWWTPENALSGYPANRDDSNPYGLNYFGKPNDASYIRLNDVSVSYRLPQSLLNKAKISRVEVFGNVKNVLTLTNFIGLDPEFTSDYGIPQVRAFLFGCRVGL